MSSHQERWRVTSHASGVAQVLMASMLVRKIDAEKGVPFPPES